MNLSAIPSQHAIDILSLKLDHLEFDWFSVILLWEAPAYCKFVLLLSSVFWSFKMQLAVVQE